ncbi:MAG: TetR/AcrR family transcriptional regulator [Peptococcaceae bacterium]|nr:TetR/AcrR family transcriptional regulator [Peptococcaceae bacterium]
MTIIIKDLDTKKRLFDSAAKVFAKKGFDKATVDEIADYAGVAKGTIYYYFRGKEELFLFLMEEGMERLRLRIESKINDADEIAYSLGKIIDIHVDFVKENSDLCIILLSEAWGISARQERLQDMLDKYYSIVGKFIDAGIAQKVIRPMDKGVIAASLFGITTVAAQHFLRKKDAFDWDPVNSQIREILLRGILVD